jgi:predicted helicase
LFSLGVVTSRDEWVYDNSEKNLKAKIKYLIKTYNNDVKKLKGMDVKYIADNLDYSIKWSRAVKNDLAKGKKYKLDANLIIDSLYRPFVKKKLYFSHELNEMQYLMKDVFGKIGLNLNKTIYISGCPASKPFGIIATNILAGLDFIEKTQCLPLYTYDKEGQKIDNITLTALDLFKKFYQNTEITKEDIFHYVYAVLHNPSYLKKYELNLKRDFPRIPFYENFAQWTEWGKQLMDLHLNYETADKYPLERHDLENAKIPKAKLKADKTSGLIILDDNTHLSGVPEIAWEYKLGNRSALEWILDQYKEKKPKDATIAEQFTTYRFADYKEQVIELLSRVCTVSVETMQIMQLLKIEN